MDVGTRDSRKRPPAALSRALVQPARHLSDRMHFGDTEPFAVELKPSPVHSAVGAFALQLVVRPTQGLRDGFAQMPCPSLPPSP